MVKTIIAKDEAEMILIPKGEFIFGIDDHELEQLHPNEVKRFRAEFHELPKEKAFLPDFYIDKFPVTNKQARRFMEESGYKKRPRLLDSKIWGAPDHPVVGVDWEYAQAYAKWAGKRLPNEREWEKAARGSDGQLFPWGNELEEIRCNCFESGLECTSKVGSFSQSVSPYGVHDMAGNVWEMTTDKWDKESLAMRGGCYLTYQVFCRVTARWAPDAEELRIGPQWLGFRCVYDPI